MCLELVSKHLPTEIPKWEYFPIYYHNFFYQNGCLGGHTAILIVASLAGMIACMMAEFWGGGVAYTSRRATVGMGRWCPAKLCLYVKKTANCVSDLIMKMSHRFIDFSTLIQLIMCLCYS